MKDTVHTNGQRIEKIRGLIAGVRKLDDAQQMFVAGALQSLIALADEAEGSLDAIEDSLLGKHLLEEKIAKRKTLQHIRR